MRHNGLIPASSPAREKHAWAGKGGNVGFAPGRKRIKDGGQTRARSRGITVE